MFVTYEYLRCGKTSPQPDPEGTKYTAMYVSLFNGTRSLTSLDPDLTSDLTADLLAARTQSEEDE